MPLCYKKFLLSDFAQVLCVFKDDPLNNDALNVWHCAVEIVKETSLSSVYHYDKFFRFN